MKILILGAGKMGSFFADLLSFNHECAVYEIDPKRMRSYTTSNALPRWMKLIPSVLNW